MTQHLTLAMIEGIIAMFVPILAITLGIGTGMLSLFLNYKKRRDMFTMYHQQRMAAIDKGVDLPPMPAEFFMEDRRHNRLASPHRTLLRGLILLLGSIGAGVALYLNYREIQAFYALIPGGIGLAFILYYLLVGRKEAIRLASATASTPVNGTNPPPPASC